MPTLASKKLRNLANEHRVPSNGNEQATPMTTSQRQE